jgi:hypothetical protein
MSSLQGEVNHVDDYTVYGIFLLSGTAQRKCFASVTECQFSLVLFHYLTDNFLKKSCILARYLQFLK